jgi:hypothetical protein
MPLRRIQLAEENAKVSILHRAGHEYISLLKGIGGDYILDKPKETDSKESLR